MTDNYMKIHLDDWRQLLGNTEQLELTVARLDEDLRRMDAVTNILYTNIEKRKLREEETP